jgi:hypothetical protein
MVRLEKVVVVVVGVAGGPGGMVEGCGLPSSIKKGKQI